MEEIEHIASVQDSPGASVGSTNNAWLIQLGDEARLDGFKLTVDFASSSLRGIYGRA